MTEPRPRGRPRSFDADQALRQASAAFRTGGYSATSLDDIARATGLNRPSLYAAFGDKKALYIAALERLWLDIDQSFAHQARRELGLRETLEQLFARSLSFYLAGEPSPQGCLAIGTATTEAAADAEIREALRRVLALMDERVAAIFERHGEARPLLKARVVTSLLHSLSIRARAGTPRSELEAMARDAVDLFAPA